MLIKLNGVDITTRLLTVCKLNQIKSKLYLLCKNYFHRDRMNIMMYCDTCLNMGTCFMCWAILIFLRQYLTAKLKMEKHTESAL